MTYREQTNLADLITELTDAQLDQTIEWLRGSPAVIDSGWSAISDDLKDLLLVCFTEQQDREATSDYLTKDQLADILGNDNAHYVWNGDDLCYLAWPNCNQANY